METFYIIFTIGISIAMIYLNSKLNRIQEDLDSLWEIITTMFSGASIQVIPNDKKVDKQD